MDKIDEYLLQEHGVIADACSSIESVKYQIAREVYLKTIDKACEWIERFAYNSVITDNIGDREKQAIIIAFKQAMKGGEE